MPLIAPVLDDRSFEDIYLELRNRIPVYTPEWSDHNETDVGITLLQLFAYLGEGLQFRFNQIPEATQVAFLKLLDVPMRPARPSQALVRFESKTRHGIALYGGDQVKAGKTLFTLTQDATIWPLDCIAVARRSLLSEEDLATPRACIEFLEKLDPEIRVAVQGSVDAVKSASGEDAVAPYEIVTMASDGSSDPIDFSNTADNCVWIAVLASADLGIPVADLPDANAGLKRVAGRTLSLSVGFSPKARFPDNRRGEAVRPGGWAIARLAGLAGKAQGRRQHRLRTGARRRRHQHGLHQRRRGAARTAGRSRDPRRAAGAGRPRGHWRLPTRARRRPGRAPLVLAARLAQRQEPHRRSAAHHAQRRALRASRGGRARAAWDRDRPARSGLHARPCAGLLDARYPVRLQVEESGTWTDWTRVDTLDASSAPDRHFVVDAEAGRVQFGERYPQLGERIRVNSYHYGGGAAGNVPPAAIDKIGDPCPGPSPPDPLRRPLQVTSALKLANPFAAYGGLDGESIDEALRRIPIELRRNRRAVARDDFASLALETPGLELGRAECMPLFHAPSRSRKPGCVSVVIWPSRDPQHPNAPLPDCVGAGASLRWLDRWRLVTTELYVIPPTYRRIAVAVSVKVREGYGLDAVRDWLDVLLRQYLAPLPPYGPDGHGWPLGRRVFARELEGVAMQVEGVEYIEALRLDVATKSADSETWAPIEVLTLNEWEVPEIAAITVVDDATALPAPGTGLSPPPTRPPVPVPVLKDKC